MIFSWLNSKKYSNKLLCKSVSLERIFTQQINTSILTPSRDLIFFTFIKHMQMYAYLIKWTIICINKCNAINWQRWIGSIVLNNYFILPHCLPLRIEACFCQRFLNRFLNVHQLDWMWVQCGSHWRGLSWNRCCSDCVYLCITCVFESLCKTPGACNCLFRFCSNKNLCHLGNATTYLLFRTSDQRWLAQGWSSFV